MNLIDEALKLQAASIGKTPADYEMRKIPCRACGGFGVGEDQFGRGTGMCGRCDGTGWVEARIKPQQEEKK